MLCMRRFEGWGCIDFAAVHQSAVGTQEPRRVRPGESGYWDAADVWLRDWMALIRGF
jgi:hypothetical protein